jgi:hypothetical protein
MEFNTGANTMTYAIIETDANGNIPDEEEERCYLNHSCLSSMSFGSLDMAWTTESHLEAEGMQARIARKHGGNNEIVEV